MNFLRTFLLKRSNRKLYRDITSSVRHTLAEDDDILSDEEKARLEEFAGAADEAKSNPDPRECAEALKAVAQDYALYSGRSSFRAWMCSVLDVLAVAFGVAFGLRALFVQPFQIPTSSMQPTLFGIHYIDREASDPYRSPVVKFFTPLGASDAKIVSPRDYATVESDPVPVVRPWLSLIPSLLHPGGFYRTGSVYKDPKMTFDGEIIHIRKDLEENTYLELDLKPCGNDLTGRCLMVGIMPEQVDTEITLRRDYFEYDNK